MLSFSHPEPERAGRFSWRSSSRFGVLCRTRSGHSCSAVVAPMFVVAAARPACAGNPLRRGSFSHNETVPAPSRDRSTPDPPRLFPTPEPHHPMLDNTLTALHMVRNPHLFTALGGEVGGGLVRRGGERGDAFGRDVAGFDQGLRGGSAGVGRVSGGLGNGGDVLL